MFHSQCYLVATVMHTNLHADRYVSVSTYSSHCKDPGRERDLKNSDNGEYRMTFWALCHRFVSPGLVTISNTLPLIPGVEMAENMSNKQSRTHDKRWSYSFWGGKG
jgi:hypothetical protein